jgi:cysteine desulfurase / selenocysteine lyase
MIYLDNAATSFPKPPVVIDAVRDYMERIGANPGRGSHTLAASAARVIFDAREGLARLLGVSDSRYLLWTPNVTYAINVVLNGFLRPGDHVVTTSMEHNAVLRPLNRLRAERGLRVDIVQADAEGRVWAADIAARVTPGTRLVVVNHASNVCGTLQPLAEIRAAAGSVPLLVDAAQSAGVVPLDVERQGISFLAVTGHKSLLGPQGTGALYIEPGLVEAVAPLICGGTGSASESTEQPGFLPDQFESGTLNGPGIAGLGAAVAWLKQRGVAAVCQHEQELCGQLLDGLARLPQAIVYGPHDPAQRTATVSLNLDNWLPDELGLTLDRRYGIMCRVGLHCAPAAHQTLGTYPHGAVRLSLGQTSTAEDVEQALAALTELAAEGWTGC